LGGDACGGLRAAALVGYSTVDGAGVAEGGKEPPRWRSLWLPWRAPPAPGEGEMDGNGSIGGHADGAGGFADGASGFADGAGGLADGAGGFADGAGGLDDVAATAAVEFIT